MSPNGSSRSRDGAARGDADAVAAAKRDADAARRAAADALADLQRATAKRARLETDLRASHARISRLRSAGGAGAAASEELDALRSLAYCAVCRERPRDRFLERCGHVLCGACVDERLASRARKCPQCGTGFSAGEVKTVYTA